MRWMTSFGCGCSRSSESSAVDRDLARELRSHLDERVAELVSSGVPAEQARRQAAREFGSVASISDQCRDTRRVSFVTHLAQDVRYAVRGLLAQPMLLTAATTSIALGVGANLAIFGLANSLLLSSPTAFKPERLVHIRTAQGSHAPYRAWREFNEAGVLSGIAGHRDRSERELARSRGVGADRAALRHRELLRRRGRADGARPWVHDRRSEGRDSTRGSSSSAMGSGRGGCPATRRHRSSLVLTAKPTPSSASRRRTAIAARLRRGPGRVAADQSRAGAQPR